MKTQPFKAIAEIVMGQSPAGESCNTLSEGIPLLNGPTEFGSYSPVPVQHTTDPKKYANLGDLLFCVRGSTTGRMNWADQQYAIGRGLAAIRHKKDSECNDYIRGLLEVNLESLLISATGSTFPNISRPLLEQLQVPVRTYDDEKRISLFIRTFNDKIELNRKMNETLEEMARAIFKSWFVDFDPVHAKARGEKPAGMPDEIANLFPSEFEFSDQLNKPIPKGWEVKSLGDITNIKHGFAFKGEFFSDMPTVNILLTPGNFKIGGGFKDSKFKYYNGEIPKGYVLKAYDLIVTMTDLSKMSDTLGFPALIPESETNIYLHNQRLGRVEFKENDYTYFLYSLMCSHLYRSEIVGGATGTTVKHTSPNKIMAHKFVTPSNEIVAFYETLIKELFFKINLNLTQIESLTSLRDSLLPKLISGEIEV